MVMTDSQKIKTVDHWTNGQKQDFITEVKKAVDSSCEGYSSDDVMQVVLVGSYVWGTPTADSDVDILVEVPLRDYLRPATFRGKMEDGKKLDIKIRDKLKHPTMDQKMDQEWHLSRYSLTKNEMIIGIDNEEYYNIHKKNKNRRE